MTKSTEVSQRTVLVEEAPRESAEPLGCADVMSDTDESYMPFHIFGCHRCFAADVLLCGGEKSQEEA